MGEYLLVVLAALGTQDKRRKRRGKPRRKGSHGLFDVQWQSDVKVAKHGHYKSNFSLVRCRHHCRHCGRVMCSDFLFFSSRIASTECNKQLLAEQEAYGEEMQTAGH
ncbi:hypothetical protein P3T76_001146 [Phytophthora citrophthora]|uniref:FYVE zinc finger domain-containing protein n=1 Tax=Phytophthora citrophthora TaxID=4793 RepID=A0AAD9LSM5_9STRA|nr:hypothetical protein P3T76_001146 [Phytophthora citrophthora]